MVATGWLSALPYLAATIAMIAASWASDKVGSRRGFVWPFLLIGAAAFAASYALGSSHFWISYALLVVAGAAMYAPYGPFFAIVPELLPKNVAGGAMALINSMGALGSFVAVLRRLPERATGSPVASYAFMSAALVAAGDPHAVRQTPGARYASARDAAARKNESDEAPYRAPPLPDDVLAYLREHADVVQADGAAALADALSATRTARSARA